MRAAEYPLTSQLPPQRKKLLLTKLLRVSAWDGQEGQRRNRGRMRAFCFLKQTLGKPIFISGRSVKLPRTSSSSSQSQPSPKRNCARLSSDEMEFNEENVSLRHILDKLANMDDRIEEHFGSSTVEISRLSSAFNEEVEAIKTDLKSVE